MAAYTWLKCPQCGGEASVVGPDSIDYCSECGVVEGQCEVVNEETGEEYNG